MHKRIVGFFCLLLCTVVLADDKFQFTTEQQRQDFIQLNEELRCPKCQNQNIADSNALIATDMKRKVYELLQQGKSKDEVIQFMKARYGDFVSYDPPMTPLTFFLYFGPVLFISMTLGYLIYHSQTGRGAELVANNQQPPDSRSRFTDNKNPEASSKELASKLAEAEKALRDLE